MTHIFGYIRVSLDDQNPARQKEPGALIGKRFFLAGGVLIVQTHADIAEDMCHECSIKVSIQTLVHHCTIRVDCRQQGAVFECSIRC